MGKSPGKWIKTVFFGKKHSKSTSSNNATAPDKKASIKIRGDDNSPVVSNPSQLAKNSAENIELEKGTSVDSSTIDRGSEVQCKFASVSLSDEEMRSQCEATTKVQAVFRGYLARRAFRALNGFIRLQALIRGHLVRRQAVATLHCMQAILKLQALARGQMVDIGENSIFESGKLATNAYVRKLLLSLPAVIPLSLQYNLDESNATWNWLKRWSSSRFWDQATRSRKVSNVKPLIKKIGSQNIEAEPGKSKRTSRRASVGDIGPLSSFETDKPKRNPKKVQTELVQEQAQSELERVKLSLRKVSASLTSAPENLETEDEKLDSVSEGKNVISAKHHVSEGKTKISAENSNSEGQIVIPDKKHVGSDALVDRVDFLEYSGKNENTRFSGDELSSRKDEKLKHKENGSVIRKRRSLPEYSENISLKPPRLPSYMMATESAKAKLRLSQVSSVELISEDDGMKVGYVRRHSLPALTDAKTSSLSPMVQNRVHATNGKVGNGKSNRSIASSKDDKVLLPGWRR